MDELSDRLSKIPSDEAKEEEIDKAIANANQFYSFEEIAKNLSSIKTLQVDLFSPFDI